MHVLSDKLRDRSIFVGWGTGVGGIVGFNIGKEGGGGGCPKQIKENMVE